MTPNTPSIASTASATWSRAIDIPENGVIIRPDSGDVLRYSQRDRLFRIQVAIV